MNKEFLYNYIIKDKYFLELYNSYSGVKLGFEDTIKDLLEDLELCGADITLEVEYLDISWLRDNTSGVNIQLERGNKKC